MKDLIAQTHANLKQDKNTGRKYSSGELTQKVRKDQVNPKFGDRKIYEDLMYILYA